ncbi:MAG: transcriptional regulator [Terriglobales bacterium]
MKAVAPIAQTAPEHVAALRRAIEIAGSQAALAKGIADFLHRPTFSQQSVSKWLREETLLAAEYWPAIEHITEGEITRLRLRPDVFSAPQPA